MSEYIDWTSTSDKEKVKLIIDHLLGWLCFESWESMNGKRLRVTSQRNDGGYPIAFWNDQYHPGRWSIFYKADHDAETFDPLCNLADAWKVVEQVGETTMLTYHPARIGDDSTCSACYSCELGEEDLYYGMYHPARAYAETAAEAVCIAALRHAGVRVVHVTKEQLTAYQVTFEDGTHMIYQEKEHAMKDYNQRVQYLKDTLQWAMQIRKLRMEEVQVPEDYFNGGIGIA